MAQIDVTVIKGTERFFTLPGQVTVHPNVSIISFPGRLSDVADLKTALSATDQHTSLKLDKRAWRVATVPAGVNPALACLMCQLADIQSTDAILDPFCGAGVIPISSLLYYRARIAIASDVSSHATAATRKNQSAADLSPDKLIVIHSDLASLKLGPSSIDKIITNMPFGIRSKTDASVYQSFAEKAKIWLKPQGLIVALTQDLKLLKSVMTDFELIGDYPLLIHGLRPHIFVYKLR